MKVKTLHEIHDEGINALHKALGPVDMILSPEERTLLEESRQDLHAGKTRSLDEVTRARNRA